MKKHTLTIIEIIIIFAIMIYYSIAVMIPEYRKSQGSSDHFIKSSQVSNMIEIYIDSSTDFALVLDLEGNIYHIFFFDNSSLSLYNENIESKTLDQGLEIVVKKLIENDIIKQDSQVEIRYAEKKYYNQFKNTWNQLVNKYSLPVNYIEKKQTIEEKAKELGINSESTAILLEIDFYSKEMIKNITTKKEPLNEEKALEYTNSIYRKLEETINTQKEENNDSIAITLIPADNEHKYYPTKRSWYKIENGKVFAFIELQDGNELHSYCYKGSMNERMKGECPYE